MSAPTLDGTSARPAPEPTPVDARPHLHRHAEAAARVRDVTGNGISVAGGWLEALASGTLDAETRERAVTSARRRLTDVQHAVDDFIQATFDVLHERGGVGPVDLAQAWREASRTPLEGAHDQDLTIVSYAPSLVEFLRRASDLLVPEVTVRGGQACIRLTDAGRLDSDARSSLKASQGSVGHSRTGASASWALVAAATT